MCLPRRCPKFPGDRDPLWGSPPVLGCTHLWARCAGGTLGTGSTGVTLLSGLSLFAFGTRLPVGTLRGSSRRERIEPTLDPCRGERGQILTGGPANPAGPGAPGSPRSPCGEEMGVKWGGGRIGGSEASGGTASTWGAVGGWHLRGHRGHRQRRMDQEGRIHPGKERMGSWGGVGSISLGREQRRGCPGSHLLAVGASGAGGTDGTRQTLRRRDR